MPRERLGLEIGQDGGLWVWGGCFYGLGRVPTARCVGGGGGRGGKNPPPPPPRPGHDAPWSSLDVGREYTVIAQELHSGSMCCTCVLMTFKE